MGACCSRKIVDDDSNSYILQPPQSPSSINLQPHSNSEDEIKAKIVNSLKSTRVTGVRKPNQLDKFKVDKHDLGRKIINSHPDKAPPKIANNSNDVKKSEDKEYILRLVTRIHSEGRFYAPVRDKLELGQARVLDVGCLRGDWVLANASLYRWSTFCGIDSLSLAHCYSHPSSTNENTANQQPLSSSPPSPPRTTPFATMSLPSPSILTSPPNTSFIPSHTLFPLPLQNDLFDFVHMNGMGLSIPTSKMGFVVSELVRVTKPGGWIEIIDNDWTLAKLGTYSERVVEEALDHLKTTLNLSTSPYTTLIPALQSHSQLDCVQVNTKKQRLGSTGGMEGSLWLDDLCGILMRFSTEIGERLDIGEKGEDGMKKTIEILRKEIGQRKTVGHRVVIVARKKAQAV